MLVKGATEGNRTIKYYVWEIYKDIRILEYYIESDKTTSIYNVSTRVLSKK